MRAENREVVVLEAQSRVMARVTGERVSAFFERMHRQRGVDIRLGVQVLAIEKNTNGLTVRVSAGEHARADVVLVATGARANDELASSAGLACDDGILVNELAATSAPDVYAIGDCARFPSRRYGRRLRLECVQNAIDHAKVLAAAIRGEEGALRSRALVLVRSVRTEVSDRRRHGRLRHGGGDRRPRQRTIFGRLSSRGAPDRGRCGEQCARLHDGPAANCAGAVAPAARFAWKLSSGWTHGNIAAFPAFSMHHLRDAAMAARQLAFLAALIILGSGDRALASPPVLHPSQVLGSSRVKFSPSNGPTGMYRYRRDYFWNAREGAARVDTNGLAGVSRLLPAEDGRPLPRRRGGWVDPPPLQ